MPLYKEKDIKVGSYYHTIPDPLVSLSKGMPWVIPCRILDLSPAEWARMLVEEYNAELIYSDGTRDATYEILIKKWAKQADARRYKNMLNRKAQEKGFYV